MAIMHKPRELPALPAPHSDFLFYVDKNPDVPMIKLLQPYKAYDSVLREIFAQEPSHPAIKDNHVNVVPVYTEKRRADIKIRARDIARESENVRQKYIMPLADDLRKPSGSPALVDNLKEFQTNFNLFSESSLSALDWNNVVAAGSSVVSSLLPVPDAYRGSKRGLRTYYHEQLAPASDVDLFLYDLTEYQAVEKIKQIEQSIRDSILEETTTIRTKNAITIVSRYPTRHVQIVLRIYKSIAEILTGFDVDCSCAAYDGKQIWLAPRAVAAYITQTNHIDISRRSPSYENRLSKYSRRGFEIMFSDLDRQRIDPTIFERSFKRSVGLARLLILEKLPNSSERDAYIDQRRRERGRPQINRNTRFRYTMHGNIKDQYDDEVAEWFEQDEVSNYHTFTIPYGEKFHAKKIEKLLYTKDLLLNAEWNKKDREVNLHRHPAFVGSIHDIVGDCCGCCPKPATLEEEEVAQEESNIYVSGDIEFIKDNPGRQAIGSFNPITNTDWTEMAYVGNTARLCQAIVDCDLEHVRDWLKQEDADPNRRDITGRTPLHLACMLSSPEIVKCLVDNGARMISRLADGRTALHLAAARGNAEIVKTLLLRSELNAEEEAIGSEQRRAAALKARVTAKLEKARSEDPGMSETEVIDDDEEDLDTDDEDEISLTTGSFVKVRPDTSKVDNLLDEESREDPDIYNVDVLAWDSNASPLHFAVIGGHVEVVKELIGSFGADVLLPIKLLNDYDRSPEGAILLLVLALASPNPKEMATALIKLGASAAQADLNQATSLHAYSVKQPELLQVLFDEDGPAVSRAINHLAVEGSTRSPSAYSPLMTAIIGKSTLGALKLLAGGANPRIEFADYIKSVMLKFQEVANRSNEQNMADYGQSFSQPIIQAVQSDLPEIALGLLRHGADPNTPTPSGYLVKANDKYRDHRNGETVLDRVRQRLKALKGYEEVAPNWKPIMPEPYEDARYLDNLKDGPYRLWMAKRKIQKAREAYDRDLSECQRKLTEWHDRQGVREKQAAIAKMIDAFETLDAELVRNGAKQFYDLYPNIKKPQKQYNYSDSEHTYENAAAFELRFTFDLPDLNDSTKEAYLDLFDAAAIGDLACIKKLTLAAWGPKKEFQPLNIAVTDNLGYSPFSLAFFRGHFSTAKAILEIARAQYSPREVDARARYSMNPADTCENEGESDDDEIQIYSEIVDERFTVDIVQELANQVKSNVAPNTMLLWKFPLGCFGNDGSDFLTYAKLRDTDPEDNDIVDIISLAVEADDLELLETAFELGSEFSPSSGLKIDEYHFLRAIWKGRTRLLSHMIRQTGVGIPLEVIVDKSGVPSKEKPKYYQGLTIHGKKRKDWADAGRNMSVRPQHKDSPLLLAAYHSNIDSVEYFSSTSPLRHYNYYADANKDDSMLQRLAQAQGGFDRAISDWLDSRSNLVLHCAVMAEPSEASEQLVSYLLRQNADLLEVRSVDGYTPLSLAFMLQRTAIAKVLVAAGADQSIRDYNGSNLLHLLLAGNGFSISAFTTGFQEMLSLIDKRLLPSMLTERSNIADPGSLTPLTLWLYKCSNLRETNEPFEPYVQPIVSQSKDCITENHLILNALLDLAGPENEDLGILDGSGNSPVHFAVRNQLPTVLKMMFARRPDLLYRENATGSTPVELAQDAWSSSCFKNTQLPEQHAWSIRYLRVYDDHVSGIETVPPKSFLPAKLASRPHKRKLVSLLEANEVARRIAGKHSSGHQGRRVRNKGRSDYEEKAENDVGEMESGKWRADEVSRWVGMAALGDGFASSDVGAACKKLESQLSALSL
ncbi:ankyrin repeat protein [Pseudovirgaria hyperparasitica]|uniref:Ankyrin repeat protein n=1 Tax=Pseudovirgaria hyperparasitica TaxID=470096 RepID=A0A6A6W712_9PEZI|nr:ankyrin repeat protein [Pseudovirgaria hyperparasitica]KAF2757357.1 ankyrin repeat protein [Pseudovirgaria hyperparasitica]